VETDALRWFQFVADGATVTEVAELHMVSQPSVSRALAALQDEIGTPLLARSGRVLRLTHAGSVFKRHVDRLINTLDDGLAAVDQLLDPERGTVVLAHDPSLGSWLVPALISGFRAEHPDVQFVVHQTGQEGVLASADSLVESRVDLVITAQRPHGIPAQWRLLFREDLFLAVPARHAWAGRTEVSMAEAAGEAFVVPRAPSPMRQRWERLVAAAGIEPPVAFEVDDLTTARGFVAAGLGVAVVPATGDDPLPPSAGGPWLVRITDEAGARDVGLVWSTERALLPAAGLFRRYLLAHGPRPQVRGDAKLGG